MNYPLSWHLLLGTEPPARTITEEEKKYAEKRLKEIGEPRWCEIELMMEKQRLMKIINVKL